MTPSSSRLELGRGAGSRPELNYGREAWSRTGMHYVYVLKNANGKHYIGITKDIRLRLRQHNQNCVTATKNRGPYSLVYQEQFDNKTAARKQENKLKNFKGNSVFKRLIETKLDPVV